MHEIVRKIDSLRIPIREKLNPVFGKYRLSKLDNSQFTIISNNCWAGHVYRYFNMQYLTPTVGLYFFADDYVRFVSDLRRYCDCELRMIKIEESHNRDKFLKQGNMNMPIGVLGDDVEIVFLHYQTESEAIEKWNRRCKRINWDNIILKFSEQNFATFEHLKTVDNLPYSKKIIFTSHDYHLNSQAIYKEWEGYSQIPDETTHFRKYVNLINLINGKPYLKNQ